MKGLLIKDFSLMKNQQRFFIMIFAIGILFLLAGNDESFAVSYMTMIAAMFTINTISYDEFEHGMAFLLTLPVNKRLYVQEKYVFGVICSAVAWIASILFALVIQSFRHTGGSVGTLLLETASVVLVSMLFISIMIPLQLKFGADKGRIALIAVCAGILLIAYGGMTAVKFLHLNAGAAFGSMIDAMNANPVLFLVIGIAIFLILCTISYLMSLRTVEKKEY